MGKKYIIEIPDDKIGDFIGSTHFLMPYMMAGHIGHHDTELPIKPYTEPDLEHVRKEAYEEGLKDAWEAARKIIRMPEGDLLNLFDVYSSVCTSVQVVLKYDVSEAIAKIKEYENSKQEIKVGDEVTDGYHNACVLFENPDGTQAMVLKQDGTTAWWHKSAYRTGRSFPEIAAVLEKMRGDKG